MNTSDEQPQRLDLALVARGLVATRAKARDLIARGEVRVDGEIAQKPALNVRTEQTITVDAQAAAQVSRGAVKLAAALEHFGLDPARRIALDIGASTGGFTQVLLERGAARVYAVDVGKGQLHPSLKDDPRVVALEECDARTLDRTIVPDAIDAIVADVSFISLRKVLPAALALAAPGCWLVALVKPQFEVGREGVGKGGIVRDPALRTEALADVREWLARQQGWTVLGDMPSPIEGGSGNVEFLLAGARA
ncbi:MAG TPA: TlyA family RNA methyltransferase [Hyphomicrobiaceae bacterium]|nr:TlyA family RNA methyltransferase [Hyphomicrobiaceae bacterium]